MHATTSALCALLLAAVAQAATVQIGSTTLTGKDIPSFKQEFYGGA